jgi:hypothetical protein
LSVKGFAVIMILELVPTIALLLLMFHLIKKYRSENAKWLAHQQRRNAANPRKY